jgi:hypothetical protein
MTLAASLDATVTPTQTRWRRLSTSSPIRAVRDFHLYRLAVLRQAECGAIGDTAWMSATSAAMPRIET